MIWETLTDQPGFCAGCVDFSAWDAATEEKALSACSASRQKRLERIEHAGARRQSIAAGWLLETILRKLGVEEPFVYGYTKRGKPYLTAHSSECLSDNAGTSANNAADSHDGGSDTPSGQVWISMAHTAHAAAAAVSFDGPVGIDLEDADRFCVNRAYERLIASRFFSENVRERIHGIEDGGETFLLLWTAAEAAAKALDEPLTDILPRMAYGESETDPVSYPGMDKGTARFTHFRAEGQIGCICQILL